MYFKQKGVSNAVTVHVPESERLFNLDFFLFYKQGITSKVKTDIHRNKITKVSIY